MELRCDNIQYSIEGSRILNGISLGVSNNEFHTILGPNGCGKTTFLKTVYRITKPDLGAIYLDGKPLAFSGTCGAGRYFSDQIHSLGCLEKNRKQDTAFGSGMGGRHFVCPHRGILH